MLLFRGLEKKSANGYRCDSVNVREMWHTQNNDLEYGEELKCRLWECTYGEKIRWIEDETAAAAEKKKETLSRRSLSSFFEKISFWHKNN